MPFGLHATAWNIWVESGLLRALRRDRFRLLIIVGMALSLFVPLRLALAQRVDWRRVPQLRLMLLTKGVRADGYF